MKRNVSKFLFNQKPFVYGLIYLLLIPIFALVYSSLSDESFFHSTSKYEYSYKNVKSEFILKELGKNITINHLKNFSYQEYQHNPDPIYAPDKFNPKYIHLNSLKYENERFFFRIFWLGFVKATNEDIISNKNQFSTSSFFTPGCFDVSFSSKYSFVKHKEKKITIFKEVFFENTKNNSDSIFYRKSIKNVFYSKDFNVPVLIFDESLNNKLIEFAKISEGFPTSFYDNFWQMFYFSSVTVTTLGYGDIVPMTNFARILVSIESILGIILVGLFLNALSKRKGIL